MTSRSATVLGGVPAGLGQLHDGLAESDELLPLLGQILAAAVDLAPSSTDGELLEPAVDLVEPHRARQDLGRVEVGPGAQPRRGVHLDVRWIRCCGGESESLLDGLVDDRVELSAELLGERRRGVRLHDQGLVAVLSVADRESAEDALRVLLEVGVDPVGLGFTGLGVRDRDLAGGQRPFDRVLGRLGVVLAAAEHQDVGDDGGAGLPIECPGR
ncbi:hypothetical protein GS416_10385 [Rhodococcus hoagii]|nr:hypothetical protein [Prescottella equi]